ncbi:peptidase M4 family protein [Legionella taurinensis]|uniref:Neutral metalloproteinase n=1 Tax=Legionella taurinensis TaxID=70611 RepID=A0A3A5LFX0_9GAMM|nr:M4 family metallopeptidase [Legionella taurinensis]MDX1838561.1 M4 family metallopeptidase [Legionella taurinensis]PUT39007.1 peptidase M4 family protein [Legionella taurinensis]PUT41094.1 peptidase M4 family protein [Legionella taurinensis]PUT43469.1 peptidase M4 family protein [Legionella taurinensis]PUT46486.1 peptidase M4 family protein [Legionella taurinensis]
MNKQMLLFALISTGSNLGAATYVPLHQASLNRLNQLAVSSPFTATTAHQARDSQLRPVSQTKQHTMAITRYQQFYKGIPVIGAQVTISKTAGRIPEQVNGHLFDNIDLDITPSLSSSQAIKLAEKAYFDEKTPVKTHEPRSELQIRADKNHVLKLVYQVSFKSLSRPQAGWPFFVIDAQTGEIINQWNNLKTYTDTGPGGNELTHEYWYGQESLPALNVTQEGENCIMEDETARLVDLKSAYDLEGTLRTPVTYRCNANEEDPVNGSYSIGNDAYSFAHVISDFYQDWYGVPVLQDEKGKAQKLIMRVHFGKGYNNAFWDGETMSFGDGDTLFYPLVSLEVASHEISHGFTQQHSDLEYHDESGALNEAFSDMAGQAARAYLLEKNAPFYNKINLTPDEITWAIGETLIKQPAPVSALRNMDMPSQDGESADCLDKAIARKMHAVCTISYPELLAYIDSQNLPEMDRQMYIVHTASGVFNRAFYLMANKIGIKTAFRVMLVANSKYWTPTTDFNEGSCGVLYAARDLNVNADVIQASFRKVGIDTQFCRPAN